MSFHINGIYSRSPIAIDVSFLNTNHRLVDAANAAVAGKQLSGAMRVTRKILLRDGEYCIGVFHHPTGLVPSGNKYSCWLKQLASSAVSDVNSSRSYINNIDDYLALIVGSDTPEEYLACVVFTQDDSMPIYAFIEHHSTPTAQEILACNQYDECVTWLTIMICTERVFQNIHSQLTTPH